MSAIDANQHVLVLLNGLWHIQVSSQAIARGLPRYGTVNYFRSCTAISSILSSKLQKCQQRT